MSSRRTTPRASGPIRSPLLIAASSLSTTTRAPAKQSSSASRIAGANEPIRSRWLPGASHRPRNERRACQRRAADDVGFADRGLDARRDACVEALRDELVGERGSARGRARPDGDVLDRPRDTMRLGQQPRDPAGADHRQMARARGCEPRRRQRRRRRGAPRRDLVAVDPGERNAGAGVVQDVRRVQPRQAARGVAGRDVDHLDAVAAALLPGRHDERGHRLGAGAGELEHLAGRQLAAAREHRPQGIDERRERQPRARLVGAVEPHRRRRAARTRPPPSGRRSSCASAPARSSARCLR